MGESEGQKTTVEGRGSVVNRCRSYFDSSSGKNPVRKALFQTVALKLYSFSVEIGICNVCVRAYVCFVCVRYCVGVWLCHIT